MATRWPAVHSYTLFSLTISWSSGLLNTVWKPSQWFEFFFLQCLLHPSCCSGNILWPCVDCWGNIHTNDYRWTGNHPCYFLCKFVDHFELHIRAESIVLHHMFFRHLEKCFIIFGNVTHYVTGEWFCTEVPCCSGKSCCHFAPSLYPTLPEKSMSSLIPKNMFNHSKVLGYHFCYE